MADCGGRAAPAHRSPALAVAADVTLGAPLSERQLGTAIRAGAQELLLPAPLPEQLAGVDRLPDRRGDAGSGGGRTQQNLPDALLLPPPLLGRDAHRVRDGEHLFRA